MGRVTRRRKASVVNNENKSGDTFVDKPNQMKNPTPTSLKAVLGDRTNLCDTTVPKSNTHTVAVNRKAPNGFNIHKTNAILGSGTVSPLASNSVPVQNVADKMDNCTDQRRPIRSVKTFSTDISCPAKRNHPNKYSNLKNISSTDVKPKKMSKRKGDVSESKDFLGFEELPHYDRLLLEKFLNSQIKLAPVIGTSKKTPLGFKINHCPVYKTIKPSPVKHPRDDEVSKLYEFKVDENEPVAKKRRPILKMGSKMFRTYKKKKKVVDILPTLNLSNQENICPNIESAVKNKKVTVNNVTKLNNVKSVEVLSNDKSDSRKDHNSTASSARCMSDVGNVSFCSEMEENVGQVVSAREEMLYSPKPYESPKRDSLSVPILRASVSENNLNDCQKSLNSSLNSSKCNKSMYSPFSAHFGSPLYMGSSTPLRSHWTEQSGRYSNIDDKSTENFDISNFFGFEESNMDPLITPIRGYTTPNKTPAKPVMSKKPSPNKLPISKVIRMLKFGSDSSNTSVHSDEHDNSLPTEELLPNNFLHGGDTPTFDYSLEDSNFPSLTKIPGDKPASNKGDKKKKVAFMEDAGCLEHAVLEKKTAVKASHKSKECPVSNNRITRSKFRNATVNESSAPPSSIVNRGCEISRMKESDFDISSFQETERKPRRSYERPAYVRSKHHDIKYEHEDDPEFDPVAENAKNEAHITKTNPKKRNALSKKEEIEFDKWAKAFNEQCMQVESFDLVVE